MGSTQAKLDDSAEIRSKKHFITLYAYCFLLACLIIFCSVEINANIRTIVQEVINIIPSS